ncbi:MAG: hypothetical protein AMXMBFR34_34420 [Myxococcaceae bacterium]
MLVAATSRGAVAGIAGTFLVHGGLPLAGGFGPHPRRSITFGGGVFFCLGFGFGGSVY